MRVVHISEKFATGDAFTLIPTGDWHLGAADCDEAQIRSDLKEHEDNPNARLILMGDIGELIGPGDKRWHPQGYMPQRYVDAMLDPAGGIPTETVKHAAEILEPWVGRIWGVASGNHEMTISKHCQRDLMTELASELGGGIFNRLLGYSGFIHVTWTHREQNKGVGSMKIHVHHGWQTAGRAGSGNLINGMERELGYTDADVLLRGHSHAPRIAQVIPSLRINRTGVAEWPRLVASTGTYKVGHIEPKAGDHAPTTYETFKNYRHKMPGAHLGPPVITIKPRRVGQMKERSPWTLEVTL
jgi:hypothetical protein